MRGGVRAAGMSHLISRVSDNTSPFIEKGGEDVLRQSYMTARHVQGALCCA